VATNVIDKDKVALARASKSIDSIIHYLPNVAVHYPSEGAEAEGEPERLCCTDCTTAVFKEGDLPTGARRAGIFKYDFSKGDSFKYSSQPKEFGNLKKNVNEHMTSDTHRDSVLKKREKET
jgi:hypothetical protein